MSDARRLTLFTVLTFPLSIAMQLAAFELDPYIPAGMHGIVIEAYGFPAAACGFLGLAMGVWHRRQTIAANFLASLPCFIAPFAGLIASLYLVCIFGMDCT
ncbi:MAG TPA: hypothetical protein VGF56_02655 [Rhizomicrobium sp.]